MEPRDVLKEFAVELLTLPVRQPVFSALLRKKGLLPGNLQGRLNAINLTVEDAAQLFVNEIDRTLLNSRDSFDKLISAMKQYKDGGMEQLAIKLEGAAKPNPAGATGYGGAGSGPGATGYGGAGSGPDQTMADRKKVLEQFQEDLLELPLDDVKFLTILDNHSLFPGNTRQTLDKTTTKSEKADYLLKNVIKRNVDIYLPQLLAAMEKYSDKHGDLAVKDLVGRMNKAMSGELPKQKDKPQRDKAYDKQPESSEDETDGGGFEIIHNQNDGSMFCSELVREEKRNAVGFIKLPNNKGGGTVIIGKVTIEGKDSTVLLTNYHVIIGGLTPENQYKDAKANDIDKVKKDIEQNAKESTIFLPGNTTIELSNGMLKENSSILSPITSLDYFLMIFDEEKLKEKNLGNIPTIDFEKKQEVTSSIVITIFQYPNGGPCSSASGICKVVDEKDKAPLLVYRCGTERGSSGGLILKTVDKSVMVPVGLHRGGYEETRSVRGYNYGSPFSEIIKSIKDNWHPKVPTRMTKAGRKAIDDVVKTLEPK